MLILACRNNPECRRIDASKPICHADGMCIIGLLCYEYEYQNVLLNMRIVIGKYETLSSLLVNCVLHKNQIFKCHNIAESVHIFLVSSKYLSI